MAFLGVVALTATSSALSGESGGNGASGVNVQKPLIYQMKDGTVLRTSGERHDLELTISQPGMQAVSISLPYEFYQVSGITGIESDRAAVIGDIGGGLFEVEILDVRKHRIVDSFVGYHAAASPNGRHVALVQFYPEHPGYMKTSDFVLVCDTTLSPAGYPPPPDPTTLGRTNVGSAVYPPGVKAGDCNAWPGDEEVNINRVTSDFIWAPDSSKFVFSAQHMQAERIGRTQRNGSTPLQAGKETDLVLVDAASPNAPETRVFVVGVCNEGGFQCLRRLESVEFGPEGLKAKLVGIYNPAVEVVEAKYEQFKAP